ncbi:MAG: TrmB family transcriptional regulator [Promethearchaeota archaeon]
MDATIPQEVYAALKEFGLTDYETRAFITLITNGIQSAKELSTHTKIPYSRIYDVLVNLENLGWVKVISGRPMQYKAQNPSFVAKLAKKQIEEKYERIENALVEKLEPFYGRDDHIESTPIWILNGNVGDKISDLINSASQTFWIYMKNLNEKILENYYEKIFALSVKKVDIRVLLNKNNIKIQNKTIWRKMGSIAKIKMFENIDFDALSIDESEMILFLSSFYNLGVTDENLVFLVQEPKLMYHNKKYMQDIWSNGEDFALKNFEKINI